MKPVVEKNFEFESRNFFNIAFCSNLGRSEFKGIAEGHWKFIPTVFSSGVLIFCEKQENFRK